MEGVLMDLWLCFFCWSVFMETAGERRRRTWIGESWAEKLGMLEAGG